VEHTTSVTYPFWERVAQERARQELTWTDLAQRTGLTRKTIHSLRTGSLPRPRTIHALADALGIDRIEAATLSGLIPAPRTPEAVLAGRAA